MADPDIKTPIKPGWRTTECWFTVLANVAGAFMASGLVADGSMPMRIAGMATMVLASMGYTVSRGLAKGGAS